MSQELGRSIGNDTEMKVTRPSRGGKPEVTLSEAAGTEALDLLLEEKDRRLRDKDDEI